MEGYTRLDLDSYVDVIRDVLKLRKNLCICRKFESLNKEVIRQKTTPIYIDVWPVGFDFRFLDNYLKVYRLISFFS